LLVRRLMLAKFRSELKVYFRRFSTSTTRITKNAV
jgi:hypothetical protein